MRAAVFRQPGPSAEVLRVEEVPTPEPGPGQVRVRMAVSGVNPTDWKSRSGATPLPLGADFQVPNQDGAGVIDKVGEGVDGSRVGERVWLYLAAWQNRYGTAAEYTVVPQERAVALPDHVSFDLGANLGVPALTAHRCLYADGDIEDRTVLVHGGAGAVGHFAIELARAGGATVISTVSSPEKARLATAAGAHHVVDYREGDPVAEIRAIAPDGVDVIAEVALGANLDLDLSVLRFRGTLSVYANNGGVPVELDVRRTMVMNTRFQFLVLYTAGPQVLGAAIEDVTAAVADGALPVGEDHGLPLLRFPLDRTADAHRAVENGAVGKVLVDLS
jgi:NADPH2:quinone reductase